MSEQPENTTDQTPVEQPNQAGTELPDDVAADNTPPATLEEAPTADETITPQADDAATDLATSAILADDPALDEATTPTVDELPGEITAPVRVNETIDEEEALPLPPASGWVVEGASFQPTGSSIGAYVPAETAAEDEYIEPDALPTPRRRQPRPRRQGMSGGQVFVILLLILLNILVLGGLYLLVTGIIPFPWW